MFDRLVKVFKGLKRRKKRKQKNAAITRQSAQPAHSPTPSQSYSAVTTAPSSSIAQQPTLYPRPYEHASFAKTEPPKTLLWAVSNGRADIVRKLLKDGADISTRNTAEISVLHIAARDGNDAILRLLLEAGANTSAQDPDTGATPLHRAAERGHTRVAYLLLLAGADVDARTIDRMTPLHKAAGAGQTNVVRLLVFFGADRVAMNVDGVTALQMAADPETEELLRVSAGEGSGCTTSNVSGVSEDLRAVGREVGAVSGRTGLIYDQKSWDEHWEGTMERLRGDSGYSKSQPKPWPATKRHRSQAIVDAVDSGQMSMKTGFSLL